MSTSSLSRQIAELEQHLGARLLNRTTRRLSLTESGQAFYERAVSLLNDLAEAEALAGQAAAKPRGTLRLTCPHNMAERRIAPAIASFVERYPDVTFDLTVTDRTIDLIDEGLDLAIRVGDGGQRSPGGTPSGPDGIDHVRSAGVPAAPRRPSYARAILLRITH